MIEEKRKKKHFNKCLITSLGSDSVHDSKNLKKNNKKLGKNFTCKYILEEEEKNSAFHATRITARQMIPVIPAPFFTYSNKELTFDNSLYIFFCLFSPQLFAARV